MDFEIAGYQPQGETDYVNTEGVEFDDFDFLTETDYVVIHETETDTYFTVVGAFDDWDDLELHAEVLFEEEEY